MGGCVASRRPDPGVQEVVRYHASCLSAVPDGAFDGVPVLEEEGVVQGQGLVTHLVKQSQLKDVLQNHMFVVVVAVDHRPFSRSLLARLVKLSRENLGVEVTFAKTHTGLALDHTAGEELLQFQMYDYNDLVSRYTCVPVTRCFKNGAQCRPNIYGDHLGMVLDQIDMWNNGEKWEPPDHDDEQSGIYTETIRIQQC